MYNIRYSKTGRVVWWDPASFTDLRPCEAAGMEDEIMELASSLTVPSTLYNSTCNLTDYNCNQLPRSHHSTAPHPSEWTLNEANEMAKRVCQDALDEARNYERLPYNLWHAKSLHDEYVEEGRFPPSLPEGISWGDESVTDEMCTTNEDGALTVVGTTALFADPYGGLFNVSTSCS